MHICHLFTQALAAVQHYWQPAQKCAIPVLRPLHRVSEGPRPTQPSIPLGSVNEYQLYLGRQSQVWLIPIADERVGVQVKLRSLEKVPYLSTSEVMIHEEALYHVYVPYLYIFLIIFLNLCAFTLNSDNIRIYIHYIHTYI